MLLHPPVSGLCTMLQTIYETESCFSSASTDANHQPLELLSGSRGSGAAMPTAGESSAFGEEGRGTREPRCRAGLTICCRFIPEYLYVYIKKYI